MRKGINSLNSEILPLPRRILQEKSLTIATIAAQVGCGWETVMKALDPERFLRLRYETVIKIHTRVEALLRASGWKGPSQKLWYEYNDVIARLRDDHSEE